MSRAHRFHALTFFAIGFVVFFALLFALLTIWQNRDIGPAPEYGITFSTRQAVALGTDWKESYLAMLDDLGVKLVRIPIYWPDIESFGGEYHWDDIDFMMDEAAARGARITLVIGRKVPRWPECYIPDWAENFDTARQNTALLQTLAVVVLRYKNHDALLRWQIENEPLLPYGRCPEPDATLLDDEIEVVRALDDRPIQLTVSGEVEPWRAAAKKADVLGISMYRVTWNDFYGYFYYPTTPAFYRTRARFFEPLPVIVSELQAEPWLYKPLSLMTSGERAQAFTQEDFEKNIRFVERTGFGEVYLWGAEWWFAERKAGRGELWEFAKNLF